MAELLMGKSAEISAQLLAEILTEIFSKILVEIFCRDNVRDFDSCFHEF
jgi:hypothetical protein